MIGWDESTWGGEKPSSYVMFWDELTDEQRGNATEVCYFEATWNRDTLQYWTTGRPTVSPTPAPSIISAIPTVAPTPEKSGSPPAALSQILALLLATSTVLILAV